MVPRLPPAILLEPQVWPQPCTLPYQRVNRVSPPHTREGTQFDPGGTLPQAGQYPWRQVPTGLNDQGQPRGSVYAPSSFSISDLYNWKKAYLKHSFPYVPECPTPFLRQGLLTKLNDFLCRKSKPAPSKLHYYTWETSLNQKSLKKFYKR